MLESFTQMSLTAYALSNKEKIQFQTTIIEALLILRLSYVPAGPSLGPKVRWINPLHLLFFPQLIFSECQTVIMTQETGFLFRGIYKGLPLVLKPAFKELHICPFIFTQPVLQGRRAVSTCRF
jgi:hypothetical protein